MEAKDYEKAGATSASMMGGIVTTQGIDHPPSKVARTSLDNVTARASTPFVKGTTTSTGLPGERVMPAQATTNSTKEGEIDTSPGECDVLGNNDGKDNTPCSGRHKHNPSIKQSATQNRRTGKRTRPDEDFNFEFEIDFTGYDPGVGGTRAERKIYRKKKLEAAAAAADAKAKAAAAAKVKAAAAAGAKVKAAAIEKDTTETGGGAVARAQGKRT